ncbi:MAG: RluA family pseudouridine synthase [Clostridia bacterium]|nr:RluA family pseudouridine synthase [Clostridia bacterium]
METIELTIPADLGGTRIDKAVSVLVPDLSRSAVQGLLETGDVFLNGFAPLKKAVVREGDRVTVNVPDPVTLSVEPQPIPLDVVYEDNDLLVVNKPKGMVVHPAAGNPDNTLVNALLAHCGDSLSGINGVIRPGIVHRIDKDTSGLLVVAKNDAAHRGLAKQIKDHSFTREYRAVVVGNLRDDSGTIDAPIGRDPKNRKKQAVTDKNSRPAVTHFTVVERYPGYTYVRVQLETGRTHQIRVHMAHIGHPVAGDTVYGGGKNTCGLQGQCLHAAKLGFLHPATGEYMEFTSDLPDYFTDFLRRLQTK